MTTNGINSSSTKEPMGLSINLFQTIFENAGINIAQIFKKKSTFTFETLVPDG